MSRFLTALNGGGGRPALSPNRLFNEYGTHLVTKIYLGGRLEYWFSSDKVASMTAAEFQISVEAAYSAVSGAPDVALGNGNKYTAEAVDMTLDVVGGESVAMAKLEGDSDTFVEWVATIPGHAHYIGRPENSLIAIWDFCDDPQRAARLKAAYDAARAKGIVERPVLFTNSALMPKGVLEVEVTVPKGYKVLSGGARVNTPHCPLVFSYPTSGGRGWVARAQHHLYEHFSGRLTVSVLAIYDPEDYYDVVMVSKECKESAQYPLAQIGVPSGYQLTGGGSRTKTMGHGNFVWMSHPTYRSSSRSFALLTNHHSVTAEEINNLYRYRLGRPQRIEGWIAISRDHGVVSVAKVTAFAIGIKPAEKFKNVMLHTRVFTKDSSTSTNPRSHIRPDAGYTLVGGGGMTTAAPTLLTASSPEYATDGAGGLAWYVESQEHNNPGSASAYAFAVGLKVLVAR